MHITLKVLKPENLTERCLNWYSDPNIVRFSDNQYRRFSMDSQYEYVANCLRDSTMDLYGIFHNDLHLGNLSITDLESIHSRAEINYLIGERSYWGKGVATFGISKIVELGKHILEVRHIHFLSLCALLDEQILVMLNARKCAFNKDRRDDIHDTEYCH